MSKLRLPLIVLCTVTLFYAYGAAVHVLNMASLTGFDWPNAPRKWQALDVVYLLLDIAVVIGLARRWIVSLVAFYAFNEGAGQTLHDLGGNGNDGQLGGTGDRDADDPIWDEGYPE